MSSLNATPRRAVLCGISDYGGFGPALPAVARDRVRLADTLKNQLQADFRFPRVDMYADNQLHLSKLEDILDDLRRDSPISEGDLLLWISGHGCERRGKPYFVTYGARIDSPGLRIEDLSEMILSIRAQRVYVVLDFCHAGALPAGLEPIRNFAMRSGPSIAVLAACRAGEVAAPGDDMTPSFSSHFIDGWTMARADERGGVSWGHIAAYIHRRNALGTHGRSVDACTSSDLRNRAVNQIPLITTAAADARSSTTVDPPPSASAGPVFRVFGDVSEGDGFACNQTGMVVTSQTVGRVRRVQDIASRRLYTAETVWIEGSLTQIASVATATRCLDQSRPVSAPTFGAEVRILGSRGEQRGSIVDLDCDCVVNTPTGRLALASQLVVQLDEKGRAPLGGAPLLFAHDRVGGTVVAGSESGLVYVERWHGLHAALHSPAGTSRFENSFWENFEARASRYELLDGGPMLEQLALQALERAIALLPADEAPGVRQRLQARRDALYARLQPVAARGPET